MASRTIRQGCQGVEAIGGDCSGEVLERAKTAEIKLTGQQHTTHALLCDAHAGRLGFPVAVQGARS